LYAMKTRQLSINEDEARGRQTLNCRGEAMGLWIAGAGGPFRQICTKP